MAKKPKSERIWPSLSPGVVRDLEQLVVSGLYGGSPTEVAENLIVEKLRELVRSGEFEKLINRREQEAKGV